MRLTVRPAVTADVTPLAELAAGTFPLACPPGLDRRAIEGFVRQHLSEWSFERYLAAPDHDVLVGVATDGRALAYALLVAGTTMDETCSDIIVGRPTLGVSKFYVDPDLHGSGAADDLLDAVVGHARHLAASSLWLATNVENTRARAFYAKSGFQQRGHRDFMIGGVRNRDVVLERDLTAGRRS